MRPLKILGVLVFLAVSTTAVARTYNGITTEYVDNYVLSEDLTNQAQVDGFSSGMSTSVTGANVFDPYWGAHWANQNVWMSDFFDTEVGTGGGDATNFDESTSAISLYAGHGSCQDDPLLLPSTKWQACTSSSTCTNPAGYGPVAANPGRCVYSPMTTTSGICMYNLSNGRMIYGSDGTTDWTISLSNTQLIWGEDPINSWTSQYGANGGMNLAILYNSCSLRPANYNSQLGTLFHGLQILQAVMPTVPEVAGQWNDLTQSNMLGYVQIDHYNHPTNLVRTSWETGFHNTSGGDVCNYGGGRQGVSGCGAAVSVAMDFNYVYAASLLGSATWAYMLDDTHKKTSNASSYAVVACNYNCSTYPVSR